MTGERWKIFGLLALVGCGLAYTAEQDFVYNRNYGVVTEDAPATDADRGTLMMGQRQATLAATTSTDGDYSTLKVDANGGLRTADSGFRQEDTVSTDSGFGVVILLGRNDDLSDDTNGSNDLTVASADREGRQFVRTDHQDKVLCRLTTTATTSTLITGCAAPGANLHLYIKDISIMGGVAVGATAAASIQYGTGGSCGTGTTVVYDCQHTATSGCSMNFAEPIRVAANSEICILDATVGTKFVTISGYIGPP